MSDPIAGPFIGKGVTFSSSPDGTTWTAIAKIVSIKPPTSKIGDVETTAYDSLIEDFIPGWENAGEAEFGINFGVTESNLLYGLRGTTKQYWQIQLPDGTSATTGTKLVFQGYINSFGIETPIKTGIHTNLKIKLQTKVTVTAAT